MRTNRHSPGTISEQAAEWLCVLAEGDGAEQADFLEWLRKSPRHVEEFLFASATWQNLREIGEREALDLDSILAEVSSGDTGRNVIALQPDLLTKSAAPRSSNERSYRAYRFRWAAGIAALTIAAVLGWRAMSNAPTYATAIGEQRTVRLEDGSVLYLNTDSHVRVRFSNRSREIELVAGEAFFAVAREPTRPFRVRTDEAIVQAVGTQFNVRRMALDTRVSVIEGRVKVEHHDIAPRVIEGSAAASPQAVILNAGEMATAANDRIAKGTTTDVAQTVAWRERRLIFKEETLENVVAEINRYNTRHFRVAGARARGTRLTATFDADKPESLAAFLQQYSDLAVETKDDAFVIRER